MRICPLWGKAPCMDTFTSTSSTCVREKKLAKLETEHAEKLVLWNKRVGFMFWPVLNPLRPVREWNLKLKTHLVISVLSASIHSQFIQTRLIETGKALAHVAEFQHHLLHNKLWLGLTLAFVLVERFQKISTFELQHLLTIHRFFYSRHLLKLVAVTMACEPEPCFATDKMIDIFI